jgi:hypothetical protein
MPLPNSLKFFESLGIRLWAAGHSHCRENGGEGGAKVLGVPDDQVQVPREPSIREINAKIPRKVSLDPDGGQTSLVFALILLGFGLIWFGGNFYYYFVHQARLREALNRNGHEAIGTITKIYSPGRRSGVLVAYKFRADGSDYHGEINLGDEPELPDGELPYLKVGESIRVQFLPGNPQVNHPIGWAWWSWWNDVFPQLFFLVFPGGGIAILFSIYRERRLARIGWVTEGEVIACAPKGKQFRVDYEFYSEDHEQFDGANENCDEYETGSKIRVIYLRNNPKRNDTYPLTSFHTVGE